MSLKIQPLKSRYTSGFIAIFSAFLLMISGDGGKGGLSLWPLFGATNQMLGCLSLVVISVWLKNNNKKNIYFMVPAVVLFLITSLALMMNIHSFWEASNYLLLTISVVLLFIELKILKVGLKVLRS